MKKVVLVTGSARGIGLGVLRTFCENGYAAVMSGVSGEDKAREALASLRASGGDVAYCRCDISQSGDRAAILDFVREKYGRLDVLVNNAGVAPLERRGILEMTEESFDRVLGVNLRGTFFMCQLFANQMLAWRDAGVPDYHPRIVNVSSISAYVSSVNRGEYCISKAGVSMVTTLFADRLAAENIPVFEVRPGIIETDMTSGVKEKYDAFIFRNGGLPLARWGTPEDLGKAVLALCGGAFDYSPGQVINVDGGFHMRRL